MLWADRIEPGALHLCAGLQGKTITLEQDRQCDLQLHQRQGRANAVAWTGGERHELIRGRVNGKPAFWSEFIRLGEYFGNAMGDIRAHYDPRPFGETVRIEF